MTRAQLWQIAQMSPARRRRSNAFALALWVAAIAVSIGWWFLLWGPLP